MLPPTDAQIIAGLGLAALTGHMAYEAATYLKRKRRDERERRKSALRARPSTRERMAEPPFYTDSPAVVRDNTFKRRNRNQL